MKKNILVVYHKNCMDGLASAVCFNILESETDDVYQFYAVQHGTPEKDNFLENLSKEQKSCTELVMVDFSLDAEQIKESCKVFEHVLILDHHKTAQADLTNPELEKIDNLEMVFDMSKSGAILAWEYVNERIDNLEAQIPKIICEYVQDRDLWQWKLPKSKEISEGLRFKTKEYEARYSDEIKAFERVVDDFIYGNENYFEKDLNILSDVGEILLEATEQSVASKIKLPKLTSVMFGDIEVLACNCTENISEVGNGICLKYNKPALMYFIIETGKVVFSLRSTDTLPDVSVIARTYGGGGHRNACGFSGNLKLLEELLNVSNKEIL